MMTYASFKLAYVIIQRGEIYLIGCHVTPMGAASTHVRPDAIRTRKLLLHSRFAHGWILPGNAVMLS